MKRMVLFYAPSMTVLAHAIASLDDRIELGVINWEVFPDQWPNTQIPDLEQVQRRDVIFLAGFEHPGDIFCQYSIMRALPRFGARSLTIILPFFSTGTSDRVSVPGEIATAHTLADIISGVPPCHGSGPARVMIYDIHALQEQFYFEDGVVVQLETAIPLLKERLETLHNVAICFPDEGAAKRFGKLFDKYHKIVCMKQRHGDLRIVTIQDGAEHITGRHCVIVDDLTMSGGTLEECRKTLMQHGADKVSAYVTHGVFPKDSWKRFTQADPGDRFAHFWVTDSCPTVLEAIKGKAPFEILSLAPLIHKTITEE